MLPLVPECFSSCDDATEIFGTFRPEGMGDDQDDINAGPPNRRPSLFTFGRLIKKHERIGVIEYTACRFKADAVLAHVQSALGVVPFEFHWMMLLHISSNREGDRCFAGGRSMAKWPQIGGRSLLAHSGLTLHANIWVRNSGI